MHDEIKSHDMLDDEAETPRFDHSNPEAWESVLQVYVKRAVAAEAQLAQIAELLTPRPISSLYKRRSMLKKTIAYEDFNGNTVVEDHYFHLTKADLIEMEMSYKGGLHQHLQDIVAAEDGKTIIAEFKQLILMAYGKRSEDGKRFIKTQQMRDEFVSSEAYSTLFLELCTNAESAAEFVNGIVPAGLDADMAKLATEPVVPIESKVLSLQEATEMDADELKSGLATGRYKLS